MQKTVWSFSLEENQCVVAEGQLVKLYQLSQRILLPFLHLILVLCVVPHGTDGKNLLLPVSWGFSYSVAYLFKKIVEREVTMPNSFLMLFLMPGVYWWQVEACQWRKHTLSYMFLPDSVWNQLIMKILFLNYGFFLLVHQISDFPTFCSHKNTLLFTTHPYHLLNSFFRHILPLGWHWKINALLSQYAYCVLIYLWVSDLI